MPSLKNAIRIDYTSKLDGFNHFTKFDQKSIDLIRGNADKKCIVIVDNGYELPNGAPHVVTDHLNFSGDNPLVGPNPAGGPRFPVINNIYLTMTDTVDPKKTMPLNNPLTNVPAGVVAGLKEGVKPTGADMKTIRDLGGEFYCYNVVPTMLVAAHLGLKVFALVVPEGESVDKDTLKYLKGE